MTVRDVRCIPLVLALALLSSAGTAHAVPLTCERSLTKESARYLQAELKALQRCEDRKVAGATPVPTSCPADPTTAARIQKAHDKFLLNVARACGGPDHVCGTGDDDALAAIGWGSIAACPNLENGACTNTIQHCGDVATCVACVDDAAVAQAMALYYAALAQSQFGTRSSLNRCQRAIGRQAAMFLRAKSAALRRCWDARLRGMHTNDCPTPGDGKAGPAIVRAETRIRSAVCRACGGPDAACGGADDVSPSDVGFTSSCPDVTVPGGPACATGVGTLSDLVGCVDCVTEFKADCADALPVPELKPYPGECNPTTTTTSTSTTTTSTTTTSSTTSTTTSTTVPTCQRANPPVGQLVLTITPGTANCGGPALAPRPQAPFSGELDDANGTKLADLGLGCLYFGGGAGHTFPASRIPDGAMPVLDVASVSGLTSLTLAGSAGTGPADCTRGAGPARHCIDASPGTDNQGTCATDADCSGAQGSCDLDANCFFGPPIPVPITSFPSLSVCIMNVISSDVCGTADLASGTSTLSSALAPRIYLTSNGATSPCPRCLGGVCTAGDRAGMSCSGGVGSESTSIECPPVSAGYIGRLFVLLSPLSTGTSMEQADADGLFCPGQIHSGAFGLAGAARIRETGAPLTSGGIGNPFATTVAGTFCVPATGNVAIDSVADLPAAGAVSIPGTASVTLGIVP